MRSRTLLIATLAASAAASAAVAGPVRHAGEWQTTIDGQTLPLVCFSKDEVMDETYFALKMSKLPGANCKVSNLGTIGPVTTYSLSCTIGGSQMTSTGTVTQTGPDSFTGKSHTHGGAIKMPNGQLMAVPDNDQLSVSKRLGPCKPGDRQEK